ncbi:uncharacterized protein [Amphiura filiformis]|uniref:uncharacterized protein n=1 Tax=Amphiura filiformis TaxID=82378 RepID=UPI003B219597
MLGILDTLYKLINNDSCKKDFVIHGGVGVLVRILQDGFTENANELQITVEILWKLTFGDVVCKEMVKKKMVNADCVQVLLRLRSSQMRSLRVAGTALLWRSGIVDLNRTMFESRSFDFTKDNYVYISCQSDMVDRLSEIRDALLSVGYKICESQSELDGNKIPTMMRNVWKSVVVVLCVSSKYKDDVICQTEAIYAQELRKTIGALIMEEDCRLDGWFGKLLRQRKVYNVYTDDLMKKNIPEIIDEFGVQSGLIHYV